MTRDRNKLFLETALLAIVFCACDLPAQARYGGGTGEPDDPYLIFTAEQMNTIGAASTNWGRHFRLMADIDLAELGDAPFNIIGTSVDKPFRGVFDGNGHTISNFVCTWGLTASIGVFGLVSDPNAEIRNVTLIAPRIGITYSVTVRRGTSVP